MTSKAAGFATWAVVELMGHQQIAGFVSEEEVAGSKLLRVDVPEIPGEVVERPAATKYFGASAIYALHPCTEELARQAAVRIEGYRMPLPVDVPDLSKARQTIQRAEDADRWLKDRATLVRGRLTGVAQQVIDEEVAGVNGGHGFDEGEAHYEEVEG